MILTVDIGGTKTRLATFNADGGIAHEVKFATLRDTNQFVNLLASTARSDFPDAQAVVVGAAGLFENGVIKSYSKLGWRDFSIVTELQKLLPGIPIWLENDCNLGALGAFSLYTPPHGVVCI